jgi:glucokinase
MGADQFPASRPADLRQTNARHLLRLIQLHSPCSKADLVRHSGLSAPTIASCMGLLEKLDLVEAIGDGKSKGGRPPLLLRFNAQHGYVAAADIGGTRLRMMLADLSGKPLAEWSKVLNRSHRTPAGMCELVRDGIKAMCAAAGVRVDRVLHLTAGAPGITDVREGVVRSAPNLTQWIDVPLRAMLQGVLKIPVEVENDTNLAAVGEHLWGAAQAVNNFVFLALGTGLGAGIFLNGQLHHGATWSAGEVGYLGVSRMPREPMRMRETGQLESAVGGCGIETRYSKRLGSGRKATAERQQLHAPEILDRAAAGEREALQVATETAGWLADAIADLVVILNPQLVVLGGGVGSHPEICRLTAEAIARHELASQLEMRSSDLGTQAQLRGAVSLSLEVVNAMLLR